MQAYTEAQAKSPEQAEPTYNAANVLYREGKFDEALKALQAAAQVAQSDALAQNSHFNAGNAAFNTQGWDAAISPIARRCCATPTTWTPRSTWSWPCSRSNNKSSRDNKTSRIKSSKSNRINKIRISNSRTSRMRSRTSKIRISNSRTAKINRINRTRIKSKTVKTSKVNKASMISKTSRISKNRSQASRISREPG